ncbi:HlyD family secretion protein [Edwardsiella ictaluri]|uniref:HlyD family secretion protein n=1 Tax=Edwardsiella ictaluri TaxID=67780 RepID=UPI002A4C150C|nr:HlyD family secretion protein [Edwardsiella ictaluri]EKS7821046.1 HlyD family secretion protein [Edwardsiella ictaluri]EKS7824380.1 HlyD family secretion protein [Edwardsiella ictaluri]EKS7827764.1 HlyD family secretion protein [Edwardsiella ictaluri]
MLKSPASRTALFLAITFSIIIFGIHKYNQQLSTRHGVVRANIIDIAPQVSGLVTQVNVRHNQSVKKGELLFSIDDGDYKISVQKAQANLANVEQQLLEQSAAVLSAKAALQNAQSQCSYMQANFQRISNLKQRDFASTNDYQQAGTDLSVSKGNVATAQARLQQAIAARGAIGPDNAQLLTARAALAKAELDLSRTRVYAPSNGNIATVNLNAGDYARPGSAVLAEVDTDNVWVEGAFPETVITGIRVGDKARIYLMADTNTVYHGHVQSIGSAINSKELPNPGLLSELPQVFDWVRLAENVPVNIQLDPGTNMENLIPGLSATVNIIK